MKYLASTFILFTIIIQFSCKQNNNTTVQTRTKPIDINSLVADTIIYDVIIRSTNPHDKWQAQSLRGLQHAKLVDSLFQLVYDKQATPYDYFTNDELNIRNIKNLETEDWFSRDQIGKLQFAERWYFNKAEVEMQKEVISIALGHELYSDSGEFRGYKPVFKLFLQP